MVATGFSQDYQTVYVLASKRIPAQGVTVEQIITKIIAFADNIRDTYGDVFCLYPDSAEQTIINTLRSKCAYHVIGSRKYPINDRIRCTDILLSSDRLKIIKGNNKALDGALRTAIWDAKHPNEDIRLDDGTTDIDTLDAFEYSFEREMYRLIRYNNNKESDGE